MGKKIDSIMEMYHLGLPAPRCIFVIEGDTIEFKLNEYFACYGNSDHLYTVRTDTIDDSMSCKRILSANYKLTVDLAKDWYKQGFQIILQEFIDERKEVKSGNIYLKDDLMIIEGAIDKHIRFTNGWSLDVNLSVSRFDRLDFCIHRFFVNQKCFSFDEIVRLIRLARKIPYTDAIVEFSFFDDGRLYFWEIKKERRKSWK